MIGEIIEIYGLPVEIVDHPAYHLAHPGEPDSGVPDDAICENCAIAVRPDTGELLLLWCCEGKNWGISREMPEYERLRTEIYQLGEAA